MTNERDFPERPRRPGISVAIVILAAGRSSRMSPDIGHKLLAKFDGIPLVRRVALRATESKAEHVYAVTGFRHEDIEDCLASLDVTVAFNPAFASGMASSLVAGLKIPGVMDHDGALILLADMPAITVENLDRLITTFERSEGRSIIRASHAGTPGNPVILPKALYPQALTLQGDRGAKALIDTSDLDILEVEIGEAAVIDVDTREDLQRQGGVSSSMR
ncbi:MULTISPECIES: nucleotidyltransferase family protein [unclassified Rhizobium]|uniref:nucleotidyltransferase family protein n=1 Tax=unclassified Rhizobium TaxID=2613769 RepID=UPI001ADBC366|nr:MULTISPECIES: nucleotidyltransferase family protein [unclassified Rhizobium]MBO9124041.1 nucleotidyltransferase family protein [Rhizobium sp. 16-488-2b]MBO9174573.1 nucleotidyltransferase family protein [Rhizobium sp. 16-488-2a]